MPPYKPGQSGNPKGKPRGTKDRRTVLRELLQPHAQDLIQKAVDMALEGDTTALRLCMERIVPPIKARAESIPMEPLEGTLVDQGNVFLHKMTEGTITPEETSHLLSALSAQAKIIEYDELDRRLTTLEESRN